ncbi:MAG: Integrase catalytic protein [Dehalococcoidales bacterium]|nr:Integrase catalytic protein [Dehalococcoidales bacterium]
MIESNPNPNIVKLTVRKPDTGKLILRTKAHLEERHFTEPEPIRCKWCGSKDIKKYGTRKDVQEYLCGKCGRKFSNKDAPYGMQTTVEQIGTAIALYYDGLSLSDVARRLDETFHNPVSRSTVYRWLVKYAKEGINLLESLKPQVSDTWVVDETVLKVDSGNLWFWDVIDEKTRFLLASHLSKSRTINDVKTVMHRAQKRAGKSPRFILSDSLGVYPDGIERIFGADSKHIQVHGLTHEINTNLIERFHSTIKERTKIIRGFKSYDTAELLMDGFLIHYNFFRPHMSLNGRTPAEVAGIKLPIKNWTDLVRKVGKIQ